MPLKRRKFIKSVVAVGAIVTLSQVAKTKEKRKAKPRVIVIGGGFSGATAAKYIKIWGTDIDVIMIERNAHFVSCPQSNLLFSGGRTLQQLTHDYSALTYQYGITVVKAEVVAIDTDRQKVTLHDDVSLDYHRLIIAPGIDFIYDDLPMIAYHEAQQKVPHAWKSGLQTMMLTKHLRAMKQGGTIIMTVPTAPYRCPPGPYERACQMAFYLKHNNPRAKLLVLDANADVVSKKSLFTSSWQADYPGIIEYIPNSTIEDIDIKTLCVDTEFDTFSADVLNVIPVQRSGTVADLAGVVNIDNRWCAVNFLTYESTDKQNVHIIGDAVYAKLPKSAHIANAQAKVCALAVVSLLTGNAPEVQPVFNNTCYSFVDNKRAGHVATVYRYNIQSKSMLPMPGGGVSTSATSLEGDYALGWAQNIWADTLN